jgi:hypothetical protein
MLAPITYEDCPPGITKFTGTFPTGPLDMSYPTSLAIVNQSDTEPGLDVEFTDGGGLHVTWVRSEKTWPGPTHIGGSIRLPKAFNDPLYLGIRREFSGLVTKDLDNAKFHIVGNQLDLTGCTRAPADQP